MISHVRADSALPEIGIDVVESGRRARKGHIALDLEKHIKFSTEGLESYAFARWEPIIYDTMVLAAAIEYGDKILKRPQSGWPRRISLRIPVENPNRWNSPAVSKALHDTVKFLTGDYWTIEFIGRSSAAPVPQQDCLTLPPNIKAVIPYSDGVDSRAVAGILSKSYGNQLVRVRIGSKIWDRIKNKDKRQPFAIVPYNVPSRKSNRESSARSRGFKFTLITAIAAHLSGAKEIIIPESGQGIIGPAIITVGHAYPDYRNHPLFTRKMAAFINSLFGTQIQFVFPRIWKTKGETLREFVSLCEGSDWEATRSCWMGNNWSSVNGKLRHCGICAACMLRRVSVHAAGLVEKQDVYVTSDMTAASLDEAVDKSFTKMSNVFREYAIGGILHMDHLADVYESDIKRHAALIAPPLNLSREVAEEQLRELLQTHSQEWRSYLDSLGEQSFVNRLVRVKQ